MPVVAAASGLLLAAPGETTLQGFLFLVVAIVLAGFWAAQRVWYEHVWAGVEFGIADVARTTGPLILRMVRLGMVGLVPALVGFALYTVTGGKLPGWFVGVLILLPMLVFDVVLTFAVPALVFRTDEPSKAMSIGWRMLKASWPASAPHAFVPVIALTVLPSFLPADVPVAVDAAAQVAIALVALLARGVTLSGYDRFSGREPRLRAVMTG